MPLPVSEIWEDTMAFVRREWPLLAPVSLALLGLSNAIAELAGSAMGPNGPAGAPGWLIAVLAGTTLVSIYGQLAIMALALRPGTSVGEALALAGKRLPKLIGITLMLVSAMIVAALPLALLLALSGIDLATPAMNLPPSVAFGVFLLMAIFAWLLVRLLPLNALLVDQDPPIIETLRRTFAMTRGHALVLLGLSALFLIVSIIVTGAASAIVGIAFGLIGRALGVAYAGNVMGALAGGMVAAAFGAISNVFITRIYRVLTQ